MIEEAYCSFEVSKLLKEKGFKEMCGMCYGISVRHNGEEIDEDEEYELKCEGRGNEIEYVEGGHLFDMYDDNSFSDSVYACPTQQRAMSWLREEQNLFIEIQCYGCEADEKAHFEYSYVISEYVQIDNKICTTVGLEQKKAKSQFKTYEEAVEEAIQYCLTNLI